MTLASRWILLLHIVLAALPAATKADIYRYVDDEGVTCFTDTPTQRDAVRIVTDGSRVRTQKKRSPVPLHLEASGIAKNMGTAMALPGREGIRPVPPVSGRITSTTGLRLDPIDGKLRHHNGFDIAVPSGTPVRAVSSGTVLFSGTRPGYGNLVILGHGDGVVTVYAHNSANLVAEGTAVEQGTVIALSGSTGRSTGPHLHFEAWRDGVNVTSSFIPGMPIPAEPFQEDLIIRTIASDGSILFTNIR